MKKKLNKILTSILLLTTLSSSVLTYVSAKEVDIYTADSDNDIKEVLSLKLSDLANYENAYSWLNQRTTFSVALKDKETDRTTYFWNAPNVQEAAINQVYADNIHSGFDIYRGVPPENQKHTIDMPKKEDATTVMQSLGFKIPTPIYLGEKPYITMSLSDVVIPKGITGVLSSIGSAIFGTSLVGLGEFKDEISGSLYYANIRDYEPNEATFDNWVKKNWNQAMKKIDANQILHRNADESTGKISGEEGVYTAQNILIDTGLSEMSQKDHEQIVAKLQETVGEQFAEVAACIIQVGGGGKIQSYARSMPYDLTAMTPKSQEIFSGINDPRAEMQRNLRDTGYLNYLKSFRSLIIGLSGKLAEWTVMINNFGTYEYVNFVGLTPEKLWDNFIARTLIDVIMICVLIYLLVQAYNMFAARSVGQGGSIVIRSIAYLWVVSLFCALLIDPKFTTEKVQSISSTFWNVMNVSLERSNTTEEFFGDSNADGQTKNNTALWLPYFNMWTIYNTNHSIMDNAQTINYDGSENEVKNLQKFEIGGKTQYKWSTFLANEFTKDQQVANGIYRAVDHFMAPRLSPEIEDGKITTANASQNENFNGYIQSKTGFAIILAQLLILFVIAVKTLLFYEFNVNLVMLLIDACILAASPRDLKKILYRIPGSAMNVALSSTWSILLVWITLSTDNTLVLLILTLIAGYATWFAIKKWVAVRGAMNPRFLSFLNKNFEKFNAKMKQGERLAESAGNSRYSQQLSEEEAEGED